MSTDGHDKFLDWNVGAVIEFLEDNEQYGDDWSEQKKGLNDLLAEVKRLREQFKLAYDWVDYQFPDGGMQDFAKYIGDDEE